MSPEELPTGPDLEAVINRVRETYPEADVVTIEGAVFFSLDAEKHFPNFATIVWVDDFDGDKVSDLSRRPGVLRVNIGVSRETFDRLVGSVADPDYAAVDRLLPRRRTIGPDRFQRRDPRQARPDDRIGRRHNATMTTHRRSRP